MKKLLVVNGPNLNLLGEREQEVYGKKSLKEIEQTLVSMGREAKIEVTFFQSNHEGEIVDQLQGAKRRFDCIIINPAAFTHTSIAIRDTLAAIGLPVIEIHMSNIYAREEFRRHSFVAPVVQGQISGFGAHSYVLAFLAAKAILAGHA
jgi:3-dehydroquinate dehydratase-2